MGNVQVCSSSGLLLVGHAKGEVRLYQFSSIAQDVTVAHISSESGCVYPAVIAVQSHMFSGRMNLLGELCMAAQHVMQGCTACDAMLCSHVSYAVQFKGNPSA